MFYSQDIFIFVSFNFLFKEELNKQYHRLLFIFTLNALDHKFSTEAIKPLWPFKTEGEMSTLENSVIKTFKNVLIITNII